MRCPYCGGYNPDGTRFCKRCGRDISQPMPPVSRPQQKPPQPPYQPPQRPPYQSPRPPSPVTPIQAPPPPSQQPRQVPPVSPVPQNAPGERSSQQRVRTPLPGPAAPEPPAPFPPRTIAQLQVLEQGALPYTLISNEVNYGRKQVIRIYYQHCSSWQQVATLLKAFKENQSAKSETIVVQGVSEQDTSVYNFTNGQLVFDRNVRLGSQMLNRYQIETENGFASDALRIVLSE